jgi:glycosyltransferase involved in cell wall biosynthesis
MNSVDVIVPCYRYGRYLRECVTSILRQSIRDIRILIINDASPDNTSEIASDLIKEDSRIMYLQHATNKGHIYTYNEGIEWAIADYLLLLSADDYLLPDALTRSTNLMDAHPEVGFTFGRVIELDESGTETRTDSFIRDEQPADYRILTGLEFINLSAQHNIVRTPTAVVRTKLQKRLGGYRAELPHTGDMEMWLRIAAHSSVGMLEEYQAVYRRHCESMSSTYMLNCWLPDLKQRKAALDCFFQTCSDALPSIEKLRGKIFRSLAVDAVGFASAAFNQGDLSLSEQLSSFALGLCPGVRELAAWKRLACKRRLGFTTWQIVRPALSKLLKSRSSMKVPATSQTNRHIDAESGTRKPQRVLFVTRSFEFGGAEKHLIALINSFGASPVKLSMFCLQKDFQFYKERLNQDDGQHIGIKSMRQLDARRGIRCVVAWWLALRRARADAVVFVYGSFWALPWHVSIAAWLAGIPRRFAIAQLPPPPPPAKARGWSVRSIAHTLKRVRHLLGVRVAAACYTSVVSVSEAVRHTLLRDYKYPSETVVTVHNGVSCSEFSRNGDSRRIVRASLAVGEEEFLLVCAARLNMHKRIDIVLSALAQIVCDGVRCKCVIVGDGPLRSELVERATDLRLNGYVTFVGFKDDVAPYLNAADAFVLTSSTEGLSLAVLEAMACGIPCIVTNVGGNPEAITNKIHGLVVHANSVREVADAIVYLIAHPEERAQMSESAERRAREMFSMDRKLAEIRHIIMT